MTTWFISRHSGAIAWIKRIGIPIDHYCEHLQPADIAAGDLVIGTLPLHLAAAVNALGVRYLHLSIELPATARGTELSAEELDLFGARLEEIEVRIVPSRSQPECTA